MANTPIGRQTVEHGSLLSLILIGTHWETCASRPRQMPIRKTYGHVERGTFPLTLGLGPGDQKYSARAEPREQILPLSVQEVRLRLPVEPADIERARAVPYDLVGQKSSMA